MTKLQKPPSSALLFSIAIHAIVFLMLYISFNKTKTTDNIDKYSSDVVIHKSEDKQLPNKMISDDTDIAISHTKKAEDNTQKPLLQANQSEVSPSKNDSASLKQSSVEDHRVMEAKSAYTKTQKNAENPIVDRPALDRDNSTTSDAALNDVQLLSTDVPRQLIDINESELKREVDEVNAQLSAAINEVKARNQQKIDEQQQQQTYSYGSKNDLN